MSTILLKFAGPLQSWGTKSHFETRHTDYYPSKSAVIGLIAASLGLKRDADAQIQRLNELKFAVRVDQQGSLLRDYHTAQKSNKDGSFERTYVTERYYLEDYIFVVGIEHEDAHWMAKIENALKNPYFQPFMGRRSNPLTMDFFMLHSQDPLSSLMETYPWQASDWYKKKKSKSLTENQVELELYTDREVVSEGIAAALRKDTVVSFSQKERKFGFRYEVRKRIKISTGDQKLKDTDHDIINAI
ncbi:type I-E CRISPR-associated protein Cas5/CasD [Aerococcaceae bacterium NML201209]|nr:type I-E CRISPR-associated protein Cas5/CasD [Aerococcaceae bacterium NML201209]MCW6664933.1 type I-E CRISPR-associated protein Cas5/CasD [Aerococcaceae bacterium NML191219]